MDRPKNFISSGTPLKISPTFFGFGPRFPPIKVGPSFKMINMMVTCKPMDEVEPLIDEVLATTNAAMDCAGADWIMWKKRMEGSEHI